VCEVGVYPMALKLDFVKIKVDFIFIVFISLKTKFQREINKKKCYDGISFSRAVVSLFGIMMRFFVCVGGQVLSAWS